MKRKKRPTALQTAKELARILTKHLAGVSNRERARRVRAGQKIMASDAAFDNRATSPSRTDSRPVRLVARGH